MASKITPEQVVTLLTRAKKRIKNKANWCKHTNLKVPKNPEPDIDDGLENPKTRWCLSGSLLAEIPKSRRHRGDSPLYRRAYKELGLRAVKVAKTKKIRNIFGAVDFNDHKRVTHKDVVKLLTMTIKELSAGE